MKNKNDGGPAFPGKVFKHMMNCNNEIPEPIYENTNGMSLRNYFAAKAMQGMLANNKINNVETLQYVESLPLACYAIADAMIKQSEENNDNTNQ